MFSWKNRFACLTRVVVTMKCMGYDVDTAIERAIFKADPSGYSFCSHPELLNDMERWRLRSQAETYFVAKSKPELSWAKKLEGR